MITCDAMDTEMSIQQTIELANVGCEIVRITAPTVKDSRNLDNNKLRPTSIWNSSPSQDR